MKNENGGANLALFLLREMVDGATCWHMLRGTNIRHMYKYIPTFFFRSVNRTNVLYSKSSIEPTGKSRTTRQERVVSSNGCKLCRRTKIVPVVLRCVKVLYRNRFFCKKNFLRALIGLEAEHHHVILCVFDFWSFLFYM